MIALAGEAVASGASRTAAAALGGAVSISGWLFDAREFQAPSQSPPVDLEAIIEWLTGTAASCAALGVRYLPVLAPAKRNVLPVAPSADRGWVAELNARLRDVDDVELMGLLSPLRHAARHGRCYQRTDAQWNDLGAFFIAHALLKEAHKTLPALRCPPLAELHLRPVCEYRGTLARASRLALVDGELRAAPGGEAEEPASEDGVVMDTSRLVSKRMPVEPRLAQAGPAPVRVYETPGGDAAARLALVGDDSTLSVVRWLAERTQRTVSFCSAAVPLAQVQCERPPVLVHVIRETDLLTGLVI